mgnify:CR=1 FL=1
MADSVVRRIGDISISTNNNVACSASGESAWGYAEVAVAAALTCVCVCALSTAWAITFNTELGDLPLMSASHSTGTISVGQTQAGTTDNVECSNRGNCGGCCVSVSLCAAKRGSRCAGRCTDYRLGVCKCFNGYVSGDSSGEALGGARGDCGHQDALFRG